MKLPCLAILLVLALAACFSRVEGFSFRDNEGSRIGLRQPRRTSRIEALFKLDQVVMPAGADGSHTLAFYLEYRGHMRGVTLEVYSGADELLRSVTIPYSSAMPVRYHVSLPPQSRIWGFRLVSEAPVQAEILAAGLAPVVSGFRFAADRLDIGELAVGLPENIAQPYLTTGEVDLSGIMQAAASSSTWIMRLGLRSLLGPPQKGQLPTAVLSFAAGESAKQSTLSVRMNTETQTITLPSTMFSQTPETLRVSTDSRQAVALSACEVSVASISELGSIPIEAGIILSYEQSQWRLAEVELFSWATLPEILIFDTLNYAVQAAYFKRLAFFAEKSGFVGTIPARASIADLHGYNAHDYRAEDLAAFFLKAAREQIPLGAEEERLKRILIANNVLQETQTGLTARRGSIISISRSSNAALRELLLSHECLHAIFFSHAAYRGRCFVVWEALSQQEQQFWRLFLEWAGYEVSMPYLVVNEFQAYVLQYDEERTNSYFRDVIAARLLRSMPNERDFIETFLRQRPESFRRSHRDLEQALWEEARLSAGVLAVRLLEQPPL